MPSIYTEKPELLEASRAFRQEQLEGFLGIEPRLCGVEVRPLTPRMAMELELAGNAFFDLREDVRAGDVLQFIFRVSATYQTGPMGFVKRCRLRSLKAHLFRLNAEGVIAEVKEYIRRTHAARPSFRRSAQPDYVPSDSCWLSHLMDGLCRWYPHLSFDGVLDTPYRIIWQLWNRDMERNDPDYKQRAPGVMEGRQKAIEEMNARLKAEFEAGKKGADGKRP